MGYRDDCNLPVLGIGILMKKLIGIVLSIVYVLSIASPAYATWKFNPFTGELDYYESAGVGAGDLLADGSVPMTANWDIGNYDITLKSLTGDGTIEGATITEGGVAVYNDDEMDAFSELNAIVTDKTLVNEEDVVTWDALQTYGADQQLGETDIKLDAALSGDEKWSGTVIAGTSGVTTLAVGDLCYLNANDSRWELVDANLSDGYDKQLGICVLAGADGAATEMLIYGKVRSAAFPAFTVGSPLYISETAGDCTHTAPVTTDAATRIIGIAITAEDLLFNPSSDYYTHT